MTAEKQSGELFGGAHLTIFQISNIQLGVWENGMWHKLVHEKYKRSSSASVLAYKKQTLQSFHLWFPLQDNRLPITPIEENRSQKGKNW